MPLSRRVSNLAALDLLTDVVRLGSMTGAARAHGVSQPSASATIRRLESRLGMRLLERGPTGSRPTADGRRVIACAQPVLDAAQALEEALSASEKGRKRTLRVAASFTIAEYLLPEWIHRLGLAVPDSAVRLAVHNSTDVLEDVRAGLADVGFVEGTTLPPDLEKREIGGDRLVLVVGPHHIWAVPGTQLEAAELAATPLVMREAGSGTREIIMQRLDQGTEHLPADPIVELGSTTAVKNAVMQGVGPALVSELAARTDLAHGHLHTVEVDGLDTWRTFHAVWPLDTRLPRLAAQLLDVAEAHPIAT